MTEAITVTQILEELRACGGKGIDEKIAIKCGVNASTVYRWRKGKTKPHSVFIKIIEGLYSKGGL